MAACLFSKMFLVLTASLTHCCTLQASHMSSAFLRFRQDFSASLRASCEGRVRPSFLHTVDKTWQIYNKIIFKNEQSVKQYIEIIPVDNIFIDPHFFGHYPTLSHIPLQQEARGLA